MIRSSLENCPVPTEQQPLNEYEELKNAWLFRDSTLSWGNYARKIFWIWAWSWLVAGPVASASFNPQKQIFNFLLCGSAGASVSVILVLVQLYLGWFYVHNRLNSSTISYEESGWYDGQIWTKPQEVINRDRLIVTYDIKPILQRLKISFGIIALMYLIGTTVWHFL
ncbi:MAG: CGLD27 family protein [Cuspidothrix sp.]